MIFETRAHLLSVGIVVSVGAAGPVAPSKTAEANPPTLARLIGRLAAPTT